MILCTKFLNFFNKNHKKPNKFLWDNNRKMTEKNTQPNEEAILKSIEEAKATEEAKKQAEINHVKSEISRIFGDTDVQHYEKLGTNGQHYQIFENHDAVYCACHVSNENHDREDFWHAIAMARSQKSTIAVRYHKSEGREELIDYIVDPEIIDCNGHEKTAETLFVSMSDDENYLALVRVPFDYQKERYDGMKAKGHTRVDSLEDHKELAAEIAVRIAALIRHDWGITKVSYSKKNDPESGESSVEEAVPQACQE